MSDCNHGFANPAHCSECMYEGNVTPPAVTIVATFRARFADTCALCTTPIEVGDLVRKRSDDSLIHYRHAPNHRRP